MKQNIAWGYEQNSGIQRIGLYFKNWCRWFNGMVIDKSDKIIKYFWWGSCGYNLCPDSAHGKNLKIRSLV
jgi:hypothetical protein